jgi:S-adenosylhomocysteine hydrolase
MVSLYFNSNNLGVKLAELVERLENVTLKGIDKTSTKHAAVHNNTNKALEPLRTRKNMNARYLWSMDDIIEGKPQITWGLLEDIFHVRNSSSY